MSQKRQRLGYGVAPDGTRQPPISIALTDDDVSACLKRIAQGKRYQRRLRGLGRAFFCDIDVLEAALRLARVVEMNTPAPQTSESSLVAWRDSIFDTKNASGHAKVCYNDDIVTRLLGMQVGQFSFKGALSRLVVQLNTVAHEFSWLFSVALSGWDNGLVRVAPERDVFTVTKEARLDDFAPFATYDRRRARTGDDGRYLYESAFSEAQKTRAIARVCVGQGGASSSASAERWERARTAHFEALRIEAGDAWGDVDHQALIALFVITLVPSWQGAKPDAFGEAYWRMHFLHESIRRFTAWKADRFDSKQLQKNVHHNERVRKAAVSLTVYAYMEHWLVATLSKKIFTFWYMRYRSFHPMPAHIERTPSAVKMHREQLARERFHLHYSDETDAVCIWTPPPRSREQRVLVPKPLGADGDDGSGAVEEVDDDIFSSTEAFARYVHGCGGRFSASAHLHSSVSPDEVNNRAECVRKKVYQAVCDCDIAIAMYAQHHMRRMLYYNICSSQHPNMNVREKHLNVADALFVKHLSQPYRIIASDSSFWKGGAGRYGCKVPASLEAHDVENRENGAVVAALATRFDWDAQFGNNGLSGRWGGSHANAVASFVKQKGEVAIRRDLCLIVLQKVRDNENLAKNAQERGVPEVPLDPVLADYASKFVTASTQANRKMLESLIREHDSAVGYEESIMGELNKSITHAIRGAFEAALAACAPPGTGQVEALPGHLDAPRRIIAEGHLAHMLCLAHYVGAVQYSGPGSEKVHAPAFCIDPVRMSFTLGDLSVLQKQRWSLFTQLAIVALHLKDWKAEAEYFPRSRDFVLRNGAVDLLRRANFVSAHTCWQKSVAESFPETCSFEFNDWKSYKKIVSAIVFNRDTSRLYVTGLRRKQIASAFPTPPFSQQRDGTSPLPSANLVTAGASAFLKKR